MPTLPTEIMTLLAHVAPLYSARTWSYVPALQAGSILTPHRRQVSTTLRALGLAQVSWFQNFHRVLNRARWSPLAACSAAPVGATRITRLRLDAALYAPAPAPDPHRRGRRRLKGARLPTLAQMGSFDETDIKVR